MRSNKEMVEWCLRQKRGIRLDEPNEGLCKEYLKKARSSLNMLGAAIERDEDEWAATIAYYARYYAVYALFQRCGVISQIHDCTLAAFACLFADKGIVDKRLYEELVASKDSRIDAQYYVMEGPSVNPYTNSESAGAFVLAIEELLDRLDEDTIECVRNELNRMLPT